jgi:hypothetical protein
MLCYISIPNQQSAALLYAYHFPNPANSQKTHLVSGNRFATLPAYGPINGRAYAALVAVRGVSDRFIGAPCATIDVLGLST